MYDAVRHLAERLETLFPDASIYVVEEEKIVPLKDKAIVIIPRSGRTEVVGIGAKYFAHTFTMTILIYVARPTRYTKKEAAYKCLEQINEIYTKIEESLAKNPVLGTYIITYVSGITDKTQKHYGYCVGEAEITLKRYDLVI